MTTIDAFHDCVKKGNLEAVRSTLAAEPELLNAANENNQSAFLLAKYYRQETVAAFLLERGATLSFFDQCIAGQTGSVLSQIEADSDLLQKHSSDGWTPLHLAAFFGVTDLAEALLDKGANVDARSTNKMLNTPLHAAVAGGRGAMVEFLLQHGADANARQAGGWTALQAAAQNGDRGMAESLIANGADVSARADNNQSALDMAMLRGHGEIAELLENLGAKP